MYSIKKRWKTNFSDDFEKILKERDNNPDVLLNLHKFSQDIIKKNKILANIIQLNNNVDRSESTKLKGSEKDDFDDPAVEITQTNNSKEKVKYDTQQKIIQIQNKIKYIKSKITESEDKTRQYTNQLVAFEQNIKVLQCQMKLVEDSEQSNNHPPQRTAQVTESIDITQNNMIAGCMTKKDVKQINVPSSPLCQNKNKHVGDVVTIDAQVSESSGFDNVNHVQILIDTDSESEEAKIELVNPMYQTAPVEEADKIVFPTQISDDDIQIHEQLTIQEPHPSNWLYSLTESPQINSSSTNSLYTQNEEQCTQKADKEVLSKLSILYKSVRKEMFR